MKNIKTLLILCVALCFITACNKENDMTLVQKTLHENADIRQIKVSDAWAVTVVADSVTFVEVEYSAYLESNVNVKMKGTQLTLGFTGSTYPVINSVYRATVHTNTRENIEAEDAAQISFVGHFSATSETLSIDLDDASVCSGLEYTGQDIFVSVEEASHFLDFQLSGNDCKVEVGDGSFCKGSFDMSSRLVADLSDASQFITFGGSAPYGEIKLQDACTLNMVQTEIGEMQVDISSASEATVNASERLEGSVNDFSTLYYKGTPQMDVDCSVDSKLIPL